ALEDAIYLSRFAAKVYLIHRRDEFRGAKILQEQALSIDNIEPLYDTIVQEVVGQDAVESLRLQNVRTKEESTLAVNGVFLAVGIHANLDGIKGLPERNEAGYIVADETCTTSIPGIFAAGDVRTKPLRQVVTAVADGANAVTSIEKYLIQ
ncbi:MAG: FAD-dependent oxidoreductase, partial [Lachnospiraceae bacterium]|nr:FAD-dependent oxidoreductase [Lachnospiraceae bacterium]